MRLSFRKYQEKNGGVGGIENHEKVKGYIEGASTIRPSKGNPRETAQHTAEEPEAVGSLAFSIFL